MPELASQWWNLTGRSENAVRFLYWTGHDSDPHLHRGIGDSEAAKTSALKQQRSLEG